MSVIIGFTGHRILEHDIGVQLETILKELNPVHCISGMAVGFDQFAAWKCVDMKIPFIAAVPFAGQDSRWPRDIKADYAKLLSKAKSIEIVCAGEYAAWKLQKRNEWIVNNSNKIVSYYLDKPGGTANCLNYAEKHGKEIYNVAKL